MRFATSVVAAVVALASSALAQTADFDPITHPTKDQVIAAGSTYVIQWQFPAKYPGDIDISLIGGKTQDTQVPLMNIASGVNNADQQYSWAVDSSLGAENVYGLVFKLASDPSIFQYSFPFHISSSSGGSTTTYGSATGSATTTITTSMGVKTVTLSSSSCTTTSAANTTLHHHHHHHPTGGNNGTVTVAPTTIQPSNTLVTSTALVAPSNTSPTAIATATGAAGHLAAVPAAILGGLAVAFFGL